MSNEVSYRNENTKDRVRFPMFGKSISYVNNGIIKTQNSQIAFAMSGLIAGGTYDVIHNLEKIIRKE